jgi:hypothetical protein
LKERITKIKERLDEFSNQAFLAWYSPYIKQDPFVNLESSFLVIVAKNAFGDYIACRFAGTLEQNEIKHQRILFEGDSLVRVRNGPRTNLVVKPFHLRYEETAVVAGLTKRVKYGKDSASFHFKRDGDIEFLKRLETILFKNVLVPVQTAPYPEPYKKVRTPDQVQPRITGELVTRLREVPGCDPDNSITDSFYEHYKHFCVEDKGGSLLFPMSQVNGKGLTVLDMSSVARETYLLPIDSLDISTETFRLDVEKTIDKDKSEWNS